jgi:hypothetical protein
VTLRSEMALDNVPGPWVEGYLPGTAGGRATINILTHFDTRSVVPSLSFGGDEMWGAAAFLELARYFAANRPRVNLRFIAFSGTWQTHALARLYVHNTLDRIGVEDRLTCAIDLSTEDRDLALDYNGLCDDAESPNFKELKPILFGAPGTGDAGLFGEIQSFFGEEHRLFGGMRALPHESEFNLADAENKRPLNRAPRFYTPNEAWEQADAISFVFQTARLWRYHHNTPLATFEKSLENAENLKPQLLMLFYLLDRLSVIAQSEERITIEEANMWKARDTSSKGYKGRVRVFSVKTAWYDKTLPTGEDGEPLGDTYLYAFPYDYAFLMGACAGAVLASGNAILHDALPRQGRAGRVVLSAMCGFEPAGDLLHVPRLHPRQERQHHLRDRLRPPRGRRVPNSRHGVLHRTYGGPRNGLPLRFHHAFRP